MQAMRKVQAGFTLIELLIVVAIVGILAAVAIPAYQDYTKKAKLSEPLAKLDELKLQAMEFYTTNGGFTNFTLADPSYSSQYVSSVGIGATANINTVEVRTVVKGVHADVNGATLCVRTTDGGKTWEGRGLENGTTTSIKKLMPKNFSTADCA